MNYLPLINSVCCGLIALSLMFFSRKGATHRPFASLLAYSVTVAAGSVPILHIIGRPYLPDPPQLVLNLLLCIALISVRGNVIELCRPSNSMMDNRFVRLLRRETWF